jgi:hypothetical protein
MRKLRNREDNSMAKANQLITDEAGVMIQRAGFCKGQ